MQLEDAICYTIVWICFSLVGSDFTCLARVFDHIYHYQTDKLIDIQIICPVAMLSYVSLKWPSNDTSACKNSFGCDVGIVDYANLTSTDVAWRCYVGPALPFWMFQVPGIHFMVSVLVFLRTTHMLNVQRLTAIMYSVHAWNSVSSIDVIGHVYFIFVSHVCFSTHLIVLKRFFPKNIVWHGTRPCVCAFYLFRINWAGNKSGGNTLGLYVHTLTPKREDSILF